MTLNGSAVQVARSIAGDLGASVLTTRAELDSLASEWNVLLEHSDANTIFLTWEWVSTWLDMVRPGARLLVVAVRDRDGHLVGIAPFYHSRMRLCRAITYRCLRVVGDCHSGAEYPDILVQTGIEDQVMPVLARVLHDQRGQWDCIWLPNVAGWTGAYQRLFARWDNGFVYRHERARDFAALVLPESHDAYLALLAHKRRGYVRRLTRNLQAEHDTRLIRCESPSDLSEMLEVLFELHRKHWESAGESGSFVRRPKMKTFYECFSPVALRKGWLRLFALKVDDTIRAVQFGYAYHGTYSALQEGYDPAFYDGIGNVLRNLAFKACIEEGVQLYDFLGEFTEHKRLWRAEHRSGYDLFIGRRSLKNSLLFHRQVWPTGRYLRECRTSPEAVSGRAGARCEPAQVSRRHLS